MLLRVPGTDAQRTRRMLKPLFRSARVGKGYSEMRMRKRIVWIELDGRPKSRQSFIIAAGQSADYTQRRVRERIVRVQRSGPSGCVDSRCKYKTIASRPHAQR